MLRAILYLSACALPLAPAYAQEPDPLQRDTGTQPASPRPAGAAQATAAAPRPALLPAGTPIPLVALEEVTSSGLVVGTAVRFTVAEDIVHGGAIVIPRGAPASGTVTWKTGKAVGGKSGKFEITFQEVVVNGTRYRLMGKHRQEGRGNTLGAVLGSIVISGRSAVMLPGQTVQALTAEPIGL